MAATKSADETQESLLRRSSFLNKMLDMHCSRRRRLTNKDIEQALDTSSIDRTADPEVMLLHTLLRNSHPGANKLGDGSLFMLRFTTRLLSLSLASPRHALRDISRGIGIAASAVQQYLSDPRCIFAVPLTQPRTLLAVVSSAMGGGMDYALGLEPSNFPGCVPRYRRSEAANSETKKTSPSVDQMTPKILALKLLQAFLSSVDELGGAWVFYHVKVGHSTGNITLRKGEIILDTPPHPLAGHTNSKASTGQKLEKVAVVFSCSLHQKSVGTDETLSTNDSDRFTFKTDDTLEIERLLMLGRALLKRKVEVVFCQRLVHPRLAMFLENEGVCVYHRLGVKRVKPIGMLCKVRVCNDWEEVLCDGSGACRNFNDDIFGTCVLGQAGAFGTVACTGDRSIVNEMPATMFLHSLTEESGSLLKESCLSYIEMLENIWQRGGKGLAGGGCWEAACSLMLKERISTDSNCQGWTRRGVEYFLVSLASWRSREIMSDLAGPIDNVSLEDIVKVDRVPQSTFSEVKLFVKLQGVSAKSELACAYTGQIGAGSGDPSCAFSSRDVGECNYIESMESRLYSVGAGAEISQAVINVGAACVI